MYKYIHSNRKAQLHFPITAMHVTGKGEDIHVHCRLKSTGHEKLRRLKPPSSCRTPRHRNSRRDTLLSQEHSAPIIVTSETSVLTSPFRPQNCSPTI